MNQRTRVAGRIAVSLAIVAAVTATYYLWVPANPTTVALTYVVVVLLIATWWGIVQATVASLIAVACFNFFFLPPFLTWTIADSQNWVAFIVFMLTAVIVSQLSGRSRRRQIEVLARQRDLERLYALSRALLLSDPTSSVPSVIAGRIAEAFALPSVALYDRHTDSVVFGGATDLVGVEDGLREVFRQAVSRREPSGVVMSAIRLGGAPIGSLALTGAELSDTVLQSVVNLAAIALERSRGQEAASRAEAARQSAELRAAVLDAVAHEFKTPLTSMKAASSDLLTSRTIGDRDRELANILDEELNRFEGLITDAVQMLRIDAGDFVVHLGRYDLAAIIDATVHRFEPRLDGHQLVKRIPEHVTVDADRDLLVLALGQLLDNALKYSPPTSMIEVLSWSNGTVDIMVRNSGSNIPPAEQARVAERFYRGAAARNIPGTGMGLAIVQQIAQVHGGTLTVSSAPATGTTFTLSLPRGTVGR